METLEGKNYITVNEFVSRIRTSRPTAYKYINEGRVKAIRLKGRWLILEESLQELLTPLKPQ